MRTKLAVACALTAFVAISGGTAEATGLIHTGGIAKGAVTLNRLSPNVQRQIMLKRIPGPQGIQGVTGTGVGIPGASGVKGDTGAKGSTGAKGDAGTNGVDGAVGPKGLTGNAGIAGTNGLPGAPGTNGTNGTNGANGTYVVVTHVTGADSNVCGGDWANDAYTRTLAMTMQPDGSIVVVRTYQGTFTTIAGASTPNGACATSQTGGKVGAFTGTDVVTITGGHFFPTATCAANCTSDAMMTAFFPGGARSLTNGWEYHYDLGAETMIQADATNRGGNEGDITLG
jgi:hypothetical protein